MSSSSLSWRKLQLALFPFLAATICFVMGVINVGRLEGSAASGYVQNGKYFLSLGHGGYIETTRDRFEQIKHGETVAGAYIAGMILSLVVMLILIKLAGKSPVRTLHPVPRQRGP